MNKKCYALLTLTPTRDFSFPGYLLGKGGVQKWGFPPGYELGVSRTTMHCPLLALHSGVADWAAILCPYDTSFYEVMGLSAFSSLLLVGFCWAKEG